MSDLLTRLVRLGRLTPEQAEHVRREGLRRAVEVEQVLRERQIPVEDVPEGPVSPASGRDAELLSAHLHPEVQAALRHPTPARMGRYLLLSELGRGGMGVVYRGFDPELNRLVAIKQLLPREGETPEVVERRFQRFQIEGRAAAKLTHPLIVRALESGKDQGRPYLVIEHVDGRDLEALLGREDTSLRRRVELLRDVAEALGHAHQQGIAHRDVKPANILVDRAGRARLTDFGLARDFEGGGAGLSRTGQILGTPHFLSPEQAGGRHDLTSPATDVFSLGGVLYQALTGQPPFPGEGLMQLLGMIASAEPERPSQLNPLINRDLETIVLKCLEKEPEKRYQDGSAVAAELERFLAGEAIQARPLGSWEKSWRWARRNKALAGLVLLSSLALVVGATSSAWAVRTERDQAQLEREHAVRARLESERARKEAERARGEAELQRAAAAAAAAGEQGARLLAQRESRAKDSLLARALAEQAQLQVDRRFYARGAALFASSLLIRETPRARSGLIVSLGAVRTRRSELGNSEWSSIAYLSDDQVAVGSEQAGVRSYDLPSLRARSFTGSKGRVLAISAAAGVLAAGTEGGQLAIWGCEDPATPTLVEAHRGALRALAFAPDGSQVATIGVDATLSRFSSAGQLLQRLDLGFQPLCLDWSQDQAWILIGGESASCLVKVADGSREHLEERWVTGVAIHRDRLVFGNLAGELVIRPLRAEGAPTVRTEAGEAICALSLSPKGQVCVGSPTGALRVFDLARGAWIYETEVAGGWIRGISQDSRGAFASISAGGALALHQPSQSRSETTTLNPALTCLAVARTGGAKTPVFYGDASGLLRFKTPSSTTTPAVIFGTKSHLTSVAYATSSVIVAAGHSGGEVLMKQAASDKRWRRLAGISTPPGRLSFVNSRRLIAITEGEVLAWDYPKPTPVWSLKHSRRLVALTCDERSSRIAVADEAGSVRVLDAGARELANFTLPSAPAALAFHPGHENLVVAQGSSLVLWDYRRKIALRYFKGRQGALTSVALSGDGRLLAAGSRDHAVRLWQVESGELMSVLEGHRAEVRDLAFLPGDKSLVSIGADGALKVWDAFAAQPSRRIPFVGPDVTFLPDGKLLGVSDGRVSAYDPRLQTWFPKFKLKGRHVRRLAASGDGRYAALAMGEGRELTVLDFSELTILAELTHAAPVRELAFLPTTPPALCTIAGSTLTIWDLDTRRPRARWELKGEPGCGLSVSPQGDWLAVGGRSKTLLFSAGGLPGPEFGLPGEHMNAGLAFSPTSRLLARTSLGARTLIDLRARSPGAALGDLAVAAESSLIDLDSGQVRSLGHHANLTCSPAFSPDGRFLLEAGAGLLLRDVATRRARAHLVPRREGSVPLAVKVSPKGEFVALLEDGRGVLLCPWRSQGALDTPREAADRVWAVTGLRAVDFDVIQVGAGSEHRLRTALAAQERARDLDGPR